MSATGRLCDLRRSSLLFVEGGVYSVKLDCLNSNCDEAVEGASGNWLSVPYHYHIVEYYHPALSFW